MYKIIKKYVSKLTYNDIKNFALKNNIILSENEIKIIYTCLNEHLEPLLTNSDKVFDYYKKYFDEDNYDKIYKLFMEYKKRYKNYL